MNNKNQNRRNQNEYPILDEFFEIYYYQNNFNHQMILPIANLLFEFK